MQIQDFFVGFVAISAGLFLVGICLVNADWYFQSWKTRWLDQRFGRSLTRVIVALLGIFPDCPGVRGKLRAGGQTCHLPAFSRRVGVRGPSAMEVVKVVEVKEPKLFVLVP